MPHLWKLIERVRRGEEIIVAKAGKLVAKLLPVGPCAQVRTPGSARGRITISVNFDAPLPDGLTTSFER